MPTKPILLDSTGQSILTAAQGITAALEDVAGLQLASKMAKVAPDFSASTAYAAGDYVFYGGTLYRFKADHSAGAWIGTDAVSVTMANEVFDIKNTLGYDEYLINSGSYTIKASDLESGQWSFSVKSANTARARTKRLLPVRAGMVISYANTTYDTYFGVLETPTSGSYVQTIGWKTDGSGVVSITKDGWLTFVVRNHADTSATVDPTEYDSVVEIRTAVNDRGLIVRGTLLTDTDLDDIDATGIYFGASGRTYSNLPSGYGEAFRLTVIRSITSTNCTQIYSEWSTGREVMRVRTVGTWSSWVASDVCVKQTQLTNGTDLDSLLPNSVCRGSSDNAYSNAPAESAGHGFLVETITVGSTTVQTLTLTDNGRLFRRTCVSGTWGSWALDTDVFRNYGGLGASADLNDILTTGVYGGTSSGSYAHRPDGTEGAFMLIVSKSATSGNVTQIYRAWDDGVEYTRNKIGSNSFGSWNSAEAGLLQTSEWDHSLKVLAIGNSYTDDCVAYAPFILRGIAPHLKLTMANLYISGADFTDWEDAWDNDTAVNYYKIKPTNTAWASASSKTVKAALHDEQWDIIILQNSATKDPVYGNEWTLGVTLLDEIVDYVATDATGYTGHAVKAGYLAPQIRYESGTPTGTFADVMALVNQFIEDSACAFVIPCTAAIENARGTTLSSYGTAGDLCYDENGHMQEGIGPLCASYCTALKILETMGIGKSGVLGESTRPTDAWLTAKNIPQQHGTSVGVTDANCRIAQKCAIQAVKFPNTVSTIL